MLNHESIELFFFFQAEDGIRDIGVTGVQTCALPISFTFTRPGTYTAALTVTDAQGASTSATPIEIVAGNQPPTVGIDLVGGNTTFFFPGVPVRYAVRVTDREDGTLRSGRIPASRVAVRAQYLPDGTKTRASP